MSAVCLNIGSSKTYIPDFFNFDISLRTPEPGVRRYTLDVGETQLPFSDESADLVFSYHTLEHVDNYLFALSEIHRVLKHGKPFLVGLPHASYPRNIANPYHKHSFNEHSFDFFDPDRLKDSAGESNNIMFRQVFLREHPADIKKMVSKIDFGLIALKGPDRRYLLPTAGALIELFDKCLDARQPYEGSK